MDVKPSVVFFGSGPVAAKALELLAENFSIEAVVTKPKPEHHKGVFPVLEVAEKLQLPLITARNKAELSKVIAAQAFKSRVAILIDFGIIVAQDVIDTFLLGIINSHFSLLPEWRGADPITFSILSGQPETGVSLMLLVEAMDEGPLLAQTPFELSKSITTPELTDNLIELSDAALKQVLPLYLAGSVESAPQEQASLVASKTPTYSRKLSKEDGSLDWQKPAEVLEREVRAYLEWPKSQTTLSGLSVTITAAHVEPGAGTPGTLWQQPKQLGYYTIHDIFVIDKLKPAGKPEMAIEAFLAGHSTNL
jgi:methionyl-tRNA formyltransferase